MTRRGAPKRSAIGAGLLALLLGATTAAGALAAVSAAQAATGRQATASDAPLPVPGKPSIPAGQALYASACVRCHGPEQRFAGRAWRKGMAPARVARTVLGIRAGHPEAVGSLTAAWEVTGYVWTLPFSGSEVRRGESLALEADRALRADALRLVLFHWNELQELRSGPWVLNHTEADVDRLMYDLAGARYASLSAADRQALIDYTVASFFEWPPRW